MGRHGLAGLVAVAVAAAIVAVGAAGSDRAGPARAWTASHRSVVRDVLTAVNAVPVDPRAAGDRAMATACAAVEDASTRMGAARPAPERRLAGAWEAVVRDVGLVARFCLDAAARGDLTMLDEVPNYLALTGGALEHLRAVMVSTGSSL